MCVRIKPVLKEQVESFVHPSVLQLFRPLIVVKESIEIKNSIYRFTQYFRSPQHGMSLFMPKTVSEGFMKYSIERSPVSDCLIKSRPAAILMVAAGKAVGRYRVETLAEIENQPV